MKKLMAIALLASLTTGCATQTYLLSPQASTATTPTKSKMQNFFVGGIGQTQEIDAAEVCHGADNVVKVQTQMSVVNGLLNYVTSGIYSPRQISVYCK